MINWASFNLSLIYKTEFDKAFHTAPKNAQGQHRTTTMTNYAHDGLCSHNVKRRLI